MPETPPRRRQKGHYVHPDTFASSRRQCQVRTYIEDQSDDELDDIIALASIVSARTDTNRVPQFFEKPFTVWGARRLLSPVTRQRDTARLHCVALESSRPRAHRARRLAVSEQGRSPSLFSSSDLGLPCPSGAIDCRASATLNRGAQQSCQQLITPSARAINEAHPVGFATAQQPLGPVDGCEAVAAVPRSHRLRPAASSGKTAGRVPLSAPWLELSIKGANTLFAYSAPSSPVCRCDVGGVREACCLLYASPVQPPLRLPARTSLPGRTPGAADVACGPVLAALFADTHAVGSNTSPRAWVNL
ncbi:hypothetical protein HPB47_023723 [Ixodes persulcatus]|uniref:Uncharacterized protein n=1 Tax=Ixodes persulcatus TaxID=34615 RepID=A0AC60Q7B4_IXOPE|nr:hypothetical protein HPB47_023723 [Ixodes persulcatus]